MRSRTDTLHLTLTSILSLKGEEAFRESLL